MKKGLAPVILIVILTLVLALGGVGVGLAWKTDYLDRWLPASVKEMFGREEKPEEEPTEEPEEPETKPEEDLTKDWEIYQGHTTYSGESKFSIRYPAEFWTLNEELGWLYSKKYEGCIIRLGVGAHGAPFDWHMDIEEEIFIGSEAAKKQTWRDEDGNLVGILAYIQEDEDGIPYMFELALPTDNQQGCINAFDQILSTFKFLEE